MKRTIIIILDGVGVGEMPDASKYGDEGSNTLGNVIKTIKELRLPNLEKLGISNIEGLNILPKNTNPIASFGRMMEKSPGKDTTTGHWEISGVILDKPFPVYPDAFPQELINDFEKSINTKILGNVVASGTEIIKELGEKHVSTGYPIVYTSADSVFQVAAHEEIIPVNKLYEICEIARSLLKDEHAVGRVIARPFIGTDGNYTRTKNRKDFSLLPPRKTLLDYISESGLEVKAVGKIEDIFANRGITESIHTYSNIDGIDMTIDFIKQDFSGLIFTNLVDFDMLYGHRNDPEGFALALSQFDKKIPDILNNLKLNDILFITADHGCDPTTPSTDHSREYVPLIVYGKSLKKPIDLGTRNTFADLGATIADYLQIGYLGDGTSFLKELT